MISPESFKDQKIVFTRLSPDKILDAENSLADMQGVGKCSVAEIAIITEKPKGRALELLLNALIDRDPEVYNSIGVLVLGSQLLFVSPATDPHNQEEQIGKVIDEANTFFSDLNSSIQLMVQ